MCNYQRPSIARVKVHDDCASLSQCCVFVVRCIEADCCFCDAALWRDCCAESRNSCRVRWRLSGYSGPVRALCSLESLMCEMLSRDQELVPCTRRCVCWSRLIHVIRYHLPFNSAETVLKVERYGFSFALFKIRPHVFRTLCELLWERIQFYNEKENRGSLRTAAGILLFSENGYWGSGFLKGR